MLFESVVEEGSFGLLGAGETRVCWDKEEENPSYQGFFFFSLEAVHLF